MARSSRSLQNVLNAEDLRDSHLLSASVYKKIRSVYPSDPDYLNPDPIAVTCGKATANVEANNRLSSVFRFATS